VLIFSRASVVAQLLTILPFFDKQKLQNISGTDPATWQLKLAADIPSLKMLYIFQCPLLQWQQYQIFLPV
jgi:hypothetical protein